MNRRLIRIADNADDSVKLPRAERRRLAKEAAKGSRLPLSDLWRDAVPPVQDGVDDQLLQLSRGTVFDPIHVPIPILPDPNQPPETIAP